MYAKRCIKFVVSENALEYILGESMVKVCGNNTQNLYTI